MEIKVGECWIDGSRKSPKYFEFTPIEMHSIGERMRLAEPALQGHYYYAYYYVVNFYIFIYP